MELYNVSDFYIDYLRNFEPEVLFNKHEKRPYVGVVYVINSINYYVPLASPKTKYNNMKNSKDFHKIDGGKYGAINFNKMIPVGDEELIKVDINNEPNYAYKNLLTNQFRELINLKNIIYRKSQGVYDLFTTKEKLTPSDIKIKKRCCDFILLEQKMNEYILKKQETQN
ncbi:MAG: type III toxin-antitoxin system ToxN/AbiQ family toxin [Oscillospiraceae bacterium]|nr:type III toxin-antitoxin system ToxN/AbiQ family toxin [Oscillospiraceae bacterium]